MDSIKLNLPPDFAGKELVVGSPQDFDAVRQALVTEKRRHRKFGDMSSLADYIQRWGSQAQTTVFASVGGVWVVLDEENPIHTAAFAPEYSFAFKDWQKMLNKAHEQGPLKEFLERRVAEIGGGTSLLSTVSNLELITTIDTVGKFDDDHNHQLSYKESTTGREGVAKLPKHFLITVPIYDGAPRTEIVIDLKLRKPKAAGESFLFALLCPHLEDIIETAMRAQIDQLKDLLEGWQIYAGKA